MDDRPPWPNTDPRLDRRTPLHERPPAATRRTLPGPDTRTTPWPPRTQVPVPDIPVDVNIATALDELDAWAIAYDAAMSDYADARRRLAAAKRIYELEAAKARRVARANPTERGRRTASDIDAEVVEATHQPDGPYDRYATAEADAEVSRTAMFAAKDQMMRLQVHCAAARAEVPRPGP